LTISVKKYAFEQKIIWDRILANSDGATLFHDLNFLEYHGDRFSNNIHHLIFFKETTPFGLMPMAVFEENNEKKAFSPYGGSFGGPIFNKLLGYSECKQVVEALTKYLDEQQISQCTITMPTPICYQRYSQTFLLALHELGFYCVKRDISSIVDLSTDNFIDLMDKRARNMARKAQKMNLRIMKNAPLSDFWIVLEKTYEKLGKNTTHKYDEFKWLMKHYPDKIYVDVAYHDGKPVAGIGYFVICNHVQSSFYLCQDPDQQHLQALSLLIFNALCYAKECGYQWFDFGTSSTNMQGKQNLFMFKESFGSVGFFRETYQWQRK